MDSSPGDWEVFTSNTEQESDDDQLDLLIKTFIELSEKQWTKYEYNRALFCKIGDLAKFTRHPHVQYKKYPVFETESVLAGKAENGFNIPVVFVTFCGIIRRFKHSDDHCWFEIDDDTSKVFCRGDLVSLRTGTVKKTADRFHRSCLEHKAKQDEFKANPSDENKDKLQEARLLWLLEHRSKKIAEELNSVYVKEVEEIEDQKVMVLGRLCQDKVLKYVMIRECRFIDNKEEKWFIELMNLGR